MNAQVYSVPRYGLFADAINGHNSVSYLPCAYLGLNSFFDGSRLGGVPKRHNRGFEVAELNKSNEEVI